jgi:hypothetical protein
MKFLYDAHIPFVFLFAVFVAAFVVVNWRAPKP